MSSPSLLLVDDDPLIRDSLGFLLRNDYRVHLAETREQALEVVSDMQPQPALALIDLGLPPTPHEPGEGFSLVKSLLARDPGMRVLVLSGQSENKNVRTAMAIGAADFVPKPCDPALLKTRLRHQMQLFDAANEKPAQAGDVLEGASTAMQGLRAQIAQFADADFPVLIEGESGTGKELVASQLHRHGKHGGEPYIAVNCAAFSSDLLASQLFGHARGAFTGATRDHSGFFEAAGKGTLFLDEIGEMSIELQSNLLRVIENGEYFSVGESTPRQSLARIVTASNQNLVDRVRAGSFRQDLYYRLSVLTIKTPPLRERGSDRLALLKHFQSVYSDKVPLFTLSDDACEAWLNYRFPGNVRELRNIVIRLGTRYPEQVIDTERLLEEFELPALDALSEKGLNGASVRDALSGGDFHLDDHLQQQEWEHIKAALDMTGDNLSKSARLLNVNRTTLYSKIQRLKEKFGS